MVDLDKGLPQEPTMVAEVLRYWLTVCDVTFLVLDGSGTSHTQALKFSEGAHEFFEQEAATGGEPRPLVPVKNKWREGERWGASADDPEEWDRLTRQLGADWAVDRDGNRVPYLKVPDDPQCDAFARQARQIARPTRISPLTFEEMAAIGSTAWSSPGSAKTMTDPAREERRALDDETRNGDMPANGSSGDEAREQRPLRSKRRERRATGAGEGPADNGFGVSAGRSGTTVRLTEVDDEDRGTSGRPTPPPPTRRPRGSRVCGGRRGCGGPGRRPGSGRTLPWSLRRRRR